MVKFNVSNKCFLELFKGLFFRVTSFEWVFTSCLGQMSWEFQFVLQRCRKLCEHSHVPTVIVTDSEKRSETGDVGWKFPFLYRCKFAWSGGSAAIAEYVADKFHAFHE